MALHTPTIADHEVEFGRVAQVLQLDLETRAGPRVFMELEGGLPGG